MTSETTTPTDSRAPAERRPIRPLDHLLVNQIAAGEVIERPASVLKELVENAIDAGASSITVDLEAGGIELVRVADNGSGIPKDQLELALAPHATSKVSEAPDLDKIATMGFRGEALASISSVARIRIVSRPTDADEGAEINAQDARIIESARPAPRAKGTTIEVRNLFHNTPARRKFLRTPSTEQTRCLEWLRDLALANPTIAFTCVCDGTTKLDVAPADSPKTRVLDILGRELESEFVEVSVDRFDDARGVLLWGLAGLPSIARATSKAQHVFLNGRTIRDKTIQHAIREAYRGLIEPGRHPSVVLMMEMSPSAVDVNVHPAKLEVRFRDQSMVHRAVYSGVRDALARADVTPSVATRLPGFGSPTEILPSAPAYPSRPSPKKVNQLVEVLSAQTPEPEKSSPSIREIIERVLDEPDDDTGADPQSLPTFTQAQRVLQVHSSYLITPDERGVLIIDQHALHERMMFNTLLTRVTKHGALESQGLLAPLVVETTADVVDRIDELGDLLRTLGIDAAPLGPKQIGVSSVPTFLISRNVDPGAFMDELLSSFATDGFVPTQEEALHEVLDMMACKAAIKAGDALSETELAEILAQREQTERAASCPHGRPTTVRLTIEELEKLFDRR